MSNFSFLEGRQEFSKFSKAAIDAERVYSTSASLCAIGCRMALEQAVTWVYEMDQSITTPYQKNLSSLVYEESFKNLVGEDVWNGLPLIVKLGNQAAHTNKVIKQYDVLPALRALFSFIQWIDYSYGSDYEVRQFDAKAIPKEKVDVDPEKFKAQAKELEEKTAQIEELRKKCAELAAQYAAAKPINQRSRDYQPENLTEFETRKCYIDVELRELGWRLKGEPDPNVEEEYVVRGMTGVDTDSGRADYVLFGKDGKPLAVVEAKRTCKDPNSGLNQAREYANCLEKMFGRRPFIFTTNGLETYFWDDLSSPQRRVSGLYSEEDLEKFMARRDLKKNLADVTIDPRITDRPYQQSAIRAVCDQLSKNVRRHLLVMATGTGKTRTAASLVDVLIRAGHVSNVLFLADRTALVKQAKDAFKNYLPDMSLCNLCEDKDDRTARVVFSTYPTMLNAIDSSRTKDGAKMFTPARFDLIIIDESHRSIFKKYKAIFNYFDAVLVGLTATPSVDVDRNTYDFFELEEGVPTYAYDYETAVEIDHVLVPYYNYEIKKKFLTSGIKYDELSDEDRERFEEAFEDEEFVPQVIAPSEINKTLFNIDTIDEVLQDLMERGIKIEGGDKLGKTIIFAQNKKHAEVIIQRFNKLFPEYKGSFAQRVLCDDSYVQTTIDAFKNPNKEPYIAVSVDMMDTGVDVPECVNLVFFKKVFSKTKFWQMIGRGTRLAPDLVCFDQHDGEYIGKRRFLIFDYCGNFEFFRAQANGFKPKSAIKPLTERIFTQKIQLIAALQAREYAGEPYQELRNSLIATCRTQIAYLNFSLAKVKEHKRQVDHFKQENAFNELSETDQADAIHHLAPIVPDEELDEFAKRFDGLIYGLMISSIGATENFKGFKSRLCKIAEMLEAKSAIPQVAAKMSEIKKINTEEYWEKKDILEFERTRRELRDLVKFTDDEGEERKTVFTHLKDPTIDRIEGKPLPPPTDLENYKKKVNRYFLEHSDDPVIQKLKHNQPLTQEDYDELERILTEELGNKEDYERNFGVIPFGLLARRIVKLDHDAALQAFSIFINDRALNHQQIEFVNKVVMYLEKNGYMEVNDLSKPPFDKPGPFTDLFSDQIRGELVGAINAVRNNATVVKPA